MGTIPIYDLLIRGGTVIDDAKAPRFDADVGIKDDRIVAVGDLAGARAALSLPSLAKPVDKRRPDALANAGPITRRLGSTKSSVQGSPQSSALQRLLTVAAGRLTHAPCHQAVI